MNRVFVGIIALVVFIGIVFFAFRTVSALRSGRLFTRNVPQAGKLVMPSGAVQVSPSVIPSYIPVISPVPQVSPLLIVSPKPSPTVYSPSTGGTLPATGL